MQSETAVSQIVLQRYRSFSAALIGCAWLCACPSPSSTEPQGPSAPDASARPNIVLVVADDLGWRDSAVYGSAYYETPNIDRLAAEGVRFRSAYSASPLCSPSRAALITGLDPGRLRFTSPLGHHPKVVLDPRMPTRAAADRRAIPAPSRTRLPLEYETIAESLRDFGYATAFFGKWHLGAGKYLPDRQGFDVAMPRYSYAMPRSYFSPYFYDDLPEGPDGEQLDERLAAEAVKFIERHRDEPFFVSLWPFSVHVPLQARPELIEKYRQKGNPADPQHNPEMGAMIETLDRALGIVLSALERLGLADDTIVWFTSDNGGAAASYGAGRPPPTSNAPLRGGKGQVYEGGIRVPLIVRWPAGLAAGVVSDQIVTGADLYPTLLELVGAAPRDGQAFDGISVADALRQRPLTRAAVFTHFPVATPGAAGLPPATAVRSGDWKLIRFYADTADQRDRLELYDLAADIGEQHDVSSENPDLVSALNAMIDAHLAATSALVPVPNPDYRPESGSQPPDAAGHAASDAAAPRVGAAPPR